MFSPKIETIKQLSKSISYKKSFEEAIILSWHLTLVLIAKSFNLNASFLSASNCEVFKLFT